MTRQVPPPISPRMKRRLQDTTGTMGVLIGVLSTGSFFITLIMSFAMQSLFGAIRTMQLLVFACLIEVTLPPHLMVFNQGCMLFASLDIFDGQSYYLQWFYFNPTDPLNQNWDEMDIGDMNFVLNSGSFFIMLAQFIIFNILKLLLNQMLKCCA